MKELIIFMGVWLVFIFFSVIFTSRKLAFLSTVPLFCGAIAYFSSKRLLLLAIFLVLLLVYLIFSNSILKKEEI